MAKLSGDSYVRIRLREEENEKPTQLKIVSVRNCDHTRTICMTVRCITSWQQDHEVYFQRTNGGRDLALYLKSKGVEV